MMLIIIHRWHKERKKKIVTFSKLSYDTERGSQSQKLKKVLSFIMVIIVKSLILVKYKFIHSYRHQMNMVHICQTP